MDDAASRALLERHWPRSDRRSLGRGPAPPRFGRPRERPPTIDTHALRAGVDLLALVGRDTRLHKIASSRGGEYAGPCPSCGGTDRFHVQPVTGIWMCRSCHDRWSDAIGYVMWRDNLSFQEAAVALGGDALRVGPPVRRAPPPPAPPARVPTDQWQARAERLVVGAVGVLWSDRGARARGWLFARGLSEAALRRFSVGFIPRDDWQDPASWGLTADAGEKVWLPHGIVLPWIDRESDAVWAVKVRRPGGEPSPGDRRLPKYVWVRGSVPTIFGTRLLGGRRTLLLPEGELDALIAWEDVGDLVDVATLGSATQGIDPRALRYLRPYGRILVARDDDRAGEQGMAKLLETSPRMRRLDLPGAHDLTDFVRQGGDLRRRVAAAVEGP